MGDRDTLLNNVDKITTYASRVQKNALSGQIDIFGTLSVDEEIPSISMDKPTGKIDPRSHLIWEKELLGLYVSTHPLDDFNNYLRHKTQSIKDFGSKKDGQPITIGGIITAVRKIYTKNNDPMAFVAIETLDGDTELVVFPRSYEKFENIWQADNVVEIKGKVNARDREGRITEEIKVIVDSAKALNHETARKWLKPTEQKKSAKKEKAEVEQHTPTVHTLNVRLASIADASILMRLKSILSSAPGSSTVIFEFTKTGQKIKFPETVNCDEKLTKAVKDLVGAENVSIDKQVLTPL